MTKLFFQVLFIAAAYSTAGQDTLRPVAAAAENNIKPHKTFTGRQWLVAGASAGLYAGSLVFLNEAWYKDYPKSSFHSFDDSREWLQVDKVGHAWSAYNLSKATTAAWQWAYGHNREKTNRAVWLGSLSGFSYLTVIEFLDAHSANWGWSWPDMAANIFGSALFASQQLTWKEQKVLFKFSAHRKNYEGTLEQRADELYGSSLPARLLKDYNGQTYWLSLHLRSVFPGTKWPRWLNIALGYGADGMYGGFENTAYDKNGNLVFDRRDIKRYRQWYLSPDIDFSRIRTNSKFLKTAFAVLNSIKFPAPALVLSNGQLKVIAIAF